MGPDSAHEEDFGRIPPHGGPQADGEATAERTGLRVGLPPSGGCNVGGRLVGVGDLRLPMTEHSRTVYCNQENYGPVSGSETEAGAKGKKYVVGTGRFVFGGDVGGGSGSGTDRGGVGEGRDGDRDERLIKWEDTVSNITLGTEPNDPRAYAPVLELHHPIMSTIGVHGGQLERERER